MLLPPAESNKGAMLEVKKEKYFFLPPLVKRCFFSQDLSIIAAYSQCHISHNEKFENRVLIRIFPCLLLHIQNESMF